MCEVRREWAGNVRDGPGGGSPGLACDPVFRGGTLCPGLTEADGLALNKSGRRMNQLSARVFSQI